MAVDRTFRWLVVAVLVAAAGLGTLAFKRYLLGVVVAGCVLDQRIAGSPFPCLAVHDDGAWGYAVVQPLEMRTEAVVVATSPIAGIESPELREPGATALWQAAWSARSFVIEALGHDLPRTGIGLALNSRHGRTQQRLHIHVDCVDAGNERALSRLEDRITEQWTLFPLRLEWHRYWVRKVKGDDLAGINPAALLADGLPEAETMGDMTIAVVGARFKDGSNGFYLLADRADPPRGDIGSAEEILNHFCVGQ